MKSDLSRMTDGDRVRLVSSADAKNQFGQVLDGAVAGETVVITRYGETQAVLISAARYNALARRPGPELNLLTVRFDAMLAEMQAPGAGEQMLAAFDASPSEMGEAAVEGSRRRATRRDG